jgi:CheY-like chemotaxis protein
MKLHPLRVLIAENEIIVAMDFQATLVSRGHEAAVATDGISALALFRRAGPFDILITDIGMPGMSGEELIRRVRSISPTLPVLIVAANSSNATLNAHGESSPRTSVLVKPVSSRDVARAAEQLAESSS